jgi:hypothetical protein
MDLDRLFLALQLAVQRKEQRSTGKHIHMFLSPSKFLLDCSQLQIWFLEVS